MPARKKVIVIGSGLGGISAAISLARENALPILVFNIHAPGSFAAGPKRELERLPGLTAYGKRHLRAEQVTDLAGLRDLLRRTVEHHGVGPGIVVGVQPPGELCRPAAATPDPASHSPHLVEFDAQKGVAIIDVGPLRYAIEVADNDQPSRQVVARRGQGCHQDRINLDLPAQRRRFAGSAARRLSVDAQRIEDHLVAVWRLLREREAQAATTPAVAVTGDEIGRAHV